MTKLERDSKKEANMRVRSLARCYTHFRICSMETVAVKREIQKAFLEGFDNALKRIK